MAEDASAKCHCHKDRDAVGACSLCGRGFCAFCRSVIGDGAVCSDCAMDYLQVPRGQDGGSSAAELAGVRTTDNTSRAASAVLFFLFSATYLPLLVYLEKSRPVFISMLVLAVVSMIFQGALIIRNSLWVWWICLALWIANMIVMHVLFFDSLDPTGAFSLVTLIFFFPIAISILVWINYRSKEIVSAALVISAVLSLILYVFLHGSSG